MYVNSLDCANIDHFNLYLFHLCFSDTVKFDNSYSWTKGKSVSYLIEVLEPTDEDSALAGQMTDVDLNN